MSGTSCILIWKHNISIDGGDGKMYAQTCQFHLIAWPKGVQRPEHICFTSIDFYRLALCVYQNILLHGWAGAIICEGVSPASWMIYSPRSVSVTSRPSASSAWLR